MSKFFGFAAAVSLVLLMVLGTAFADDWTQSPLISIIQKYRQCNIGGIKGKEIILPLYFHASPDSITEVIYTTRFTLEFYDASLGITAVVNDLELDGKSMQEGATAQGVVSTSRLATGVMEVIFTFSGKVDTKKPFFWLIVGIPPNTMARKLILRIRDIEVYGPNDERFPCDVIHAGSGGLDLIRILGDVDGDGEISVWDAVRTLGSFHTNSDYEIHPKCGDVNGDGKVSFADARYILQRALWIINYFPAEVEQATEEVIAGEETETEPLGKLTIIQIIELGPERKARVLTRVREIIPQIRASGREDVEQAEVLVWSMLALYGITPENYMDDIAEQPGTSVQSTSWGAIKSDF